jgi:hypothetical protein
MRSIVLTITVLGASVAVASGEYGPGAAGGSADSRAAEHATHPQNARGALQFFTDEAAFVAALGVPAHLVVETFDGGAPPGQFPRTCDEPMDSMLDDDCFAPGQLVPGFAVTSTSGSGIVIFPEHFLGPRQLTRIVGATSFADTTNAAFTPSISAASAEVYGGTSLHAVDVEVLDESGAPLGTTTVLPGATRDTPVFFGVISPIPVGRITFNAQDNAGELIDHLQFRTAGNLPPGLEKSFVPPAVAADDASTLTITIGNQGQPGPAILNADLTDPLPDGLFVAATPNAATTCADGTVIATPGGDTVTLASGAEIPGAGICTVTVDVSAAIAGLYTNTIPAGALQTDLGNNTDAATATLIVSSGDTNTFPPAENFDGTFAPLLPTGWVTSTTTGADDWTTSTTVSDSGPNSAYAPNLAATSDFTLDSPEFIPVEGQNVAFRHLFNLERRFDGAVLEISIGGGEFADILAAGGSFVTGGYVSYPLSDSTGNPLGGQPAWTGNSNGFVTTIASLPASAVGQPTRLRWRTAADGSASAPGDPGWWVDSIVLGIRAQPPIASVTPASLSFALAPDATATAALAIANATGSDPLTFSVESRGPANGPARLTPYADLMEKAYASADKPLVPRPLVSLDAHGFGISQGQASSPWVPRGSILFQLDDGTAESALGVGISSPDPLTEYGVVWINRFSASDALAIHSISVFWPEVDMAGGDLLGLQANLVVYYDVDADGDPTDAVRVGTDALVPIMMTGNFQTYQTNFSIPAAGDVYIGFVDQWALAGGFTPRLYPAAIDETASQGMSFVSSVNSPPADIVNLGNNDNNQAVDANLMIRATATGGGGGGPCSGPIANWLSATPSSGSVDGGATASVTVTANPSAASLAPGDYTAELCITTNDPAHSLVSVPVTMTVELPLPLSCDGGADEIFCAGFEPTPPSASIISGAMNLPVDGNGGGNSFDFAPADYHTYDPSIRTDDFNLYALNDDGMFVYW